MSIFDTDVGHWIAVAGIIILIGMDAIVAVIAYRLLRWHHGNGVRLAALEAWRVVDAARRMAAEEASQKRRASDKAAHCRRATDRTSDLTGRPTSE